MSAKATNENPPARIGRYDVVFPLETRILSNLVVGRLGEPGAPPVTIMQFDPDLTQDRDLETFLFSVREALGVRHPNVAAIRELRNDDGAVYLVMDHLEGESAAALIHRLDVEGRALDFELTAHVMAEATSALEAGHELGLLHEHLTPHDIFIGYDGSVKVLDIGIARALDELLGAKTIAERDLPYASPERCKGEPLDGRSDVYSLGAMLWELMTGASPFERKTQADTLRAILTDEPKVSSTKVLRRLPTELSNIALRALARDPAERYATAKAFGDALRAFVRSVPMGGAEPSTPLATLMQSQFAKRIKNNTRMLRRFDAGTRSSVSPDDAPPPSSRPDISQLDRPTVDAFRPEPLPIEKEPETPRVAVIALPEKPPPPEPAPEPPPEPPPEVPPEVLEVLEMPEVLEVPEVLEEVASPLAAAPPEPAPHVEIAEAETSFPEPHAADGKRRGVWLVLALAVVLGLTAIVFISQLPSERPVAAPPVATVEPKATTTPTPSAAPSSSAAAEATATIHIETTPSKATIILGSTTMGVTPIDLKLPRSTEPVTVEVRATGYQPVTESIVPDADQRFKFSLAVLLPTPPPTPVPAAASAPAPTPAAASASASPYFRFQ